MAIKLKNNAVSFLTTAIVGTDVGLTITTGDGSKFPTLGVDDYFYATITDPSGNYEVVKVTAVSGSSMTIVRGQEGTIGLSFPVGSRIEQCITAQSILDVVTQTSHNLGDYADDAAAATAGIPVGFLYRTGSAVKIRVS